MGSVSLIAPWNRLGCSFPLAAHGILLVVSCLPDFPVLVIPLLTTIIIVLLIHAPGPALLTLWRFI